MPNTLLTPSIISKESLMILENNLVMANRVNRKFENQFVKIGASLTVRKPNRFTVTSGPGLAIQNIAEPSTSITVSNQKHVDFSFSATELSLTVEEFSERYLKTGMAELANTIDFDVMSNFNQVYNLVGTPGTTPTTFATSVQLVGQRMDEEAVPQDMRTLVLNPASYWAIANGLTSLFVESVAEAALKGFLAKIGNFSVYMDQNVQNQTVGALGGSGVTASAGQTGSSLVTNGWTASVTNLLRLGDVITVAGVNAVNPKSRQSTGVLRNFVVTAAVNSDSSGGATIPIFPAITTTGAYQTVNVSPASGAAIVIKTGTAGAVNPNNLAFVRDAFGLVMVPMEIPGGVDFSARETYKDLSIRIIRAYDINNDVLPCRMDVLYGTATYYPELAVRLTS